MVRDATRFLPLFLLQFFSGCAGPPETEVLVGELDGAGAMARVTRPTADHVLVIYNSSDARDTNANGTPDSREIAEYYQARRGIADSHLCGIDTSTEEVVGADEYSERIRPQVEACLDSRGLREQVRFLVVTKGVPLKVPWQRTDSYSCGPIPTHYSVDQLLCLLYQTDGLGEDRFWNPYYGADMDWDMDARFQSFSYVGTFPVSYLVTRLDGYELGDILAMIDRGAAPYRARDALFVLDNDPRLYSGVQSNIAGADSGLRQQGYLTSYETTTTWQTENASLIMGYTSGGVHASMGDGYYDNLLRFNWAPGALCHTFESFNGFGFESPSQSTHGQVAEFVATGGTGGIGNVAEPCFSGMAFPSTFYIAYAKGYSLAEAAYLALPYLNWMTVVVGDPLAFIEGPELLPSAPSIDFAPDGGAACRVATRSLTLENRGNVAIGVARARKPASCAVWPTPVGRQIGPSESFAMSLRCACGGQNGVLEITSDDPREPDVRVDLSGIAGSP